MTELSFLIDLLLNQKLNTVVKKLIADRIREIEARPQTIQSYAKPIQAIPPHLVGQSPSTIANFMKEGVIPQVIPETTTTAPAVVVASPAAAQAMESRKKAIAVALSGKEEPGRTSPRKF